MRPGIGSLGGRGTFVARRAVNLTDTTSAKPYRWNPRVHQDAPRLVCSGPGPLLLEPMAWFIG